MAGQDFGQGGIMGGQRDLLLPQIHVFTGQLAQVLGYIGHGGGL